MRIELTDEQREFGRNLIYNYAHLDVPMYASKNKRIKAVNQIIDDAFAKLVRDLTEEQIQQLAEFRAQAIKELKERTK
jgi:methionine salvage enolase-phosphatase E1